MATTQQQAPTPQQLAQSNAMARQLVLGTAIKMKQQIYSAQINPNQQNVINLSGNTIRNVGLLLGFIVEVSGTLETAASAVAANRTPFGTANLVQQFQFNDLSNYTRIQIPGWHLATLNSVRQGFGYGGVYDNNIPMGYGNNFPVYEGPSSLTAETATNVRMMYYVPIAYSSTDLRGAIYMGTVSATSNLQITLNQTPIISSTDNPINGAYQMAAAGSPGGWSGNATVTVYQVYLDQLPKDKNGNVILPVQDLNIVYELKQTTFTTPTQGQDFPMAYSNFRSFLSTFAVFDNGGVYNDGSDVNYWSLASANFTNIFKLPPEIVALQARASIMTDFPLGSYFFESRDIPVNTINYGNMELNLNASSASSGARVLVGYEAFAQISQLVGASSLGGG